MQSHPVWVEFEGAHLSMAEVGRRIGLSREGVRVRIARGVPLEQPKNQQPKGKRRCKNCGVRGHYAKTCTERAAGS